MKGTWWLVILLPAIAASCTPVYIYGRTSEVIAPARPADCRFDVLETPPQRSFDEIGVIAPPDIEYGTLSGGMLPFIEAVRGLVCPAGGDAVVVEKNMFNNYARAVVLKYR